MNRCVSFCLGWFCLIWVSAPLHFNGAETYTPLSLEGWTVRVHQDLKSKPQLYEQTRRLLETKLYEIKRIVPKEPLLRLQQVHIVLDESHPAFAGAVYHPSKDWLQKHGHDPSVAGCVHIANATNFLNWTTEQPMMVLHELAHAYHHQVLGYDHAGIRQAYHNAIQSASYQSVMRYHGGMEKAYALNNDQEYFAEATEAFFGTNDYYPFVRAELKHHDPECFALLQKIWEKN